ncbi:MAG: hypothetical protein K0S29_842, partial [Gammaproteobacteria bacterium]|nr:hypothetical protein [Gammaproteobacteria bacterium]
MPKSNSSAAGFRSLLVGLQNFAIAFLAVYAAQSRAEQSSDTGDNSSSLALSIEQSIMPHALDYSRPDFVASQNEKEAATAKLNQIFKQIVKDYQQISGQELVDFMDDIRVRSLMYIGDLAMVRLPLPSASDYGYFSFLKAYVFLSTTESFEIFCNSGLVDWTKPDTAQAKNWLLMRGELAKIQILHRTQMQQGIGNVFDVADENGLRPIEWLLSQTGKNFPQAPSVSFLEELEWEGITHITQDLKENPKTRKLISSSDNIELIRAYLPRPSDPDYAKIVYDIAFHALKNQKLQVVKACLSLPGFDPNRQSGENAGQTLLMLALERGEFDIAEQLIDNPDINFYTRDQNGLMAVHYFDHYPYSKKSQTFRAKIIEKDPKLVFVKDYAGSVPVEVSSFGKEAGDITFDNIGSQAKTAHRVWLEELTGIVLDYDQELFSMQNREFLYKAFSRIWNSSELEFPWVLAVVDPLEKYKGYNLMDFVTQCTSAEQFKQILLFDSIPWHAPEYAFYREAIFNRVDGFEHIKLLYQWGLDHGHANIFDLPNAEGLNPLQVIFERFAQANSPLMLSKIYETYARYERAGIIHFEKDFGVSLSSLPLSDQASFKKMVNDKIQAIKKASTSTPIVPERLAWLYSLEPRFIFGWGQILFGTGLLLLTLLIYMSQVPQPVPAEAAPLGDLPRRRRERLSFPSPQQQNVISEDPALSRAREERTAWAHEKDYANSAVSAALVKQTEAESKAKTMQLTQPVLANLYTELAQTYQASCQAYQSYANAIDQVQTAVSAEARNAAIIQAQAAKPDNRQLQEACRNALTVVKRQERAIEERAREAEAQARREGQQQAVFSKEQKFNQVIERLGRLEEARLLPRLIQLKSLLEQAQAIGLDINKTKPKLAPFVGEKERLEKQLAEQIAGLNIYSVFGFATNPDKPVAARIQAIKDFRAQLEAIGHDQDPLQDHYKTATEFLISLSGEKKQYERLVDFYQDEIKDNAKAPLPLVDRLNLVKKLYEQAKEAMFQLGKNEEELAAAKEIIEALQKQYHAMPAVPARGGAGGSASSHAVQLPAAGFNKDDLRYSCQLLESHLLNYGSGRESASAECEEDLLLALIYSFARLMELLKDKLYEARILRNMLVHAYYEARSDKGALLELIGGFVDYKKLLLELQKDRSGDLPKWINESKFYKKHCLLGKDYRVETRDYPEIEMEWVNAINGLKAFAAYIDRHIGVKGVELAADANISLRDASKMRVMIIGELLKGPCKNVFVAKLKSQSCDVAKLMHHYQRFEEDAQQRIGALQESATLIKARNIGAHEVHLVTLAGGLYSVSSELSGSTLSKIAHQFVAIDPERLSVTSGG